MYYFGSVAHLMAIFLFVIFTYRNYTSEVSQAFIAVSTSDGSDCQTVSIAVSGQYLADSGGNWIGTPSFVDSKALYSLEFANFEISSISQYNDMMAAFQRSFDIIGEISLQQNLPENLLFWMSFIQYYSVANPQTKDFAAVGYGQLQSIELTGNPENVFDLEYITSSVSGINGKCPIPSVANFDQANSELTTVYSNYTRFIADPLCSDALNPKSFGYVSQLDDNTYTMRLDVRSFATAMAVNYGVLPVATLKTVNYAPKSFRYMDVTFNIGQYFDVRYRLMETITCMTNSSVIPPGTPVFERLCFYVVGETFALPVFNHYGADPVAPLYCDCELPIGTSQNCQEFNLLSGLVFYKSPPSAIKQGQLTKDLTSFGVYSLLDMMSNFPNYRSFNRAAYNASFIGSASSFQPTPDDLASAFEFCRINVTHTCSLFLFDSFQPTSFEVSDYKYQVFNGSCQNSTTIAPQLW